MDVNDYAIFVMSNIKKAKLGNALNITDKVIENYDVKEFITSLYNALIEMKNYDKRVVDCINSALNGFDKKNPSMTLDKMIISIWKIYNGQ